MSFVQTHVAVPLALNSASVRQSIVIRCLSTEVCISKPAYPSVSKSTEQRHTGTPGHTSANSSPLDITAPSWKLLPGPRPSLQAFLAPSLGQGYRQRMSLLLSLFLAHPKSYPRTMVLCQPASVQRPVTAMLYCPISQYRTGLLWGDFLASFICCL